MTLRAVVFGLLTLLCSCASTHYRGPAPSSRAAQAPQAPMAGRVGIMSLLGNDLRHIHAGSTPFGNFEKSYLTQFDFNGFAVEELRKGMLTKTPYQPVIVGATGLMLRQANTWQDTWNGRTFDANIQREIEGIMKQNRLAMLVVVSCPTISDGVVGTGQHLTGSGLYTRTFLGSTHAAVFSTLQFFRIVGQPAQLVLPITGPGDRSIGDLPHAQLPDDLEDMPARDLVPVYDPLRSIVRNKVQGFLNLPRKLGA